jgi:hypothetical protein
MQTFKEAFDSAVSNPNWLGDYKVVNGLLRQLAHQVLTSDQGDEHQFTQHAEKLCKGVAETLLGKDPKFPGPTWNSPGNIDVYIGRQEGVDSNDPIERVTGGLFNMIGELLTLSGEMGDKFGLNEQWQWQAGQIINTYTSKFMGLPLSGFDQDDTRPASEKSAVTKVPPSPFKK